MNSSANVNHLNIDNDSVLTYCCKYRIFDIFKTLKIVNNLDRNIRNNDDMTAALYLVEYERNYELQMIIDESMNFHYMNKANETPITLLFKKYYKYYQNGNIESIRPLWYIIRVLVDNNVNLNVPIDKNGNTPLLFLIMVEDWYTVKYLLMNSRSLDVSLRNSSGIDPLTLFSLKLSQNFNFKIKDVLNLLFEKIKRSKSSFVDPYGNNLLMYSALNNSADSANSLLEDSYDLIKQTNLNQETPLIVCAKLGADKVAKEILKYRFIQVDGHYLKTKYTDINHKDVKGNTALHYAVQLKDYNMANLISFHKADKDIKNNEGLTPMELAGKDETMINYLNHPINYNDDKIKDQPFPISEYRNKYRKSYEPSISQDYQANPNIDDEIYYYISEKIFFTVTPVIDDNPKRQLFKDKIFYFVIIFASLISVLLTIFIRCLSRYIKMQRKKNN